MNDVYFKLFVAPWLTKEDIAAPAPPSLTLTIQHIFDLEHEGQLKAQLEGRSWASETFYARAFLWWIEQCPERRKLEITLSVFHKTFATAFVSLLIRDDDDHPGKIILSIAPIITPEGFECCFRDIYFNLAVKGTPEHNTNHKTGYTINLTD